MYLKFLNTMIANCKKLPFSYQEVEYIQSSGTQYIDVGVSLDHNCGIKCKAMYISKPSTHADVCGFIVGPLNGGATINWRIQGGNPAMFFSDSLSSTSYIGNYYNQFAANVWYELAMNAEGNRKIILDGVNYGNIGSFNGSYDVYLFASYNVYGGSVPYGMATIRVSSLILYDENGNESANLIPCYRKSDSVVGMYDIVRNIFLTNAGTGDFTHGPNV